MSNEETPRFRWPFPAWNADWQKWQDVFEDLITNVDAAMFSAVDGTRLIFKSIPNAEIVANGPGYDMVMDGPLVMQSRAHGVEVTVPAGTYSLETLAVAALTSTPGAVGAQSIEWEMLEGGISSSPDILPLGYVDDSYNITWWNGARLVAGAGNLPLFGSAAGSGGTPGGSDGQIQYNNGGVFGGASEFTYNDSTDKVGLRNTAPFFDIDVVNPASAGASVGVRTYHDSASPGLLCVRSRGTAAARTAVQSGDILGSLNFMGFHGSSDFSVHNPVAIMAEAVENFTAGAGGTDLALFTCPVGGTIATRRVTVTAEGDLDMYSGAISVQSYNGTAIAGAIEWDGSNFRGYDGASWVNLDSAGGGGDGEVYINDIVPNGGGNVGTKVYTTGSDDKILESCVSDDSSLRVYVIALIGPSNLRPSVTVNGTAVGNWDYTAYQDDNRVLFRGYADITLVGTTVTATHEDGSTASCTVAEDVKPVISTLVFANGYPGSQTELKAGDEFDISVTADLAFVEVEVEDSGACDSQSEVVASTTNTTITSVIADRGTTNVARPARVRVKKSTGTWSDWVYTNAGGSVDGINLVNCNNLYPSVEAMTQVSITYPATQEAIKDSETVSVHCTCSDYDTIAYSSPNSDLSIPSSTTYVEDKTGISRIAGSYNLTTTNYRVSCNRAANDADTVEDLVVYVAHVAATVTMSEASRLRTGGTNGTTTQGHTITLTANQELRIAPTIAAPSANGGTWDGLFTGGPLVWTRTLQCHDTDDTPGTYTYQALSAYNLANIETTSYTGDSNYVIGGFVSRVIALAAFANEATFTAKVADYAKCTLTWTVKSLPNKRAFNTTTTPDANSWCLAGTLGVSPTTARILDTAAASSSSDETSLTIEETI